MNPETGLVFWTNAAHCTTPDGRAPSATEVKNCRQRVHRIIYALDPKLILAFGSSACLSVLGQTVDTTRKSGTIMAASVPSPVDPKNVLSYPMLACPDIGAMARAGDDRLIRNKQGMAYQMLETLRFAYRILENTP
ncbi:hypothetical protein EBT31_00110 [bacterium]|nr:hypothetical protein [bacterium]